MRKILRIMAAAAVASACWLGTATAADYPVSNVTLIVPTGPGGGGDIAARLIAQKLSVVFGKSVIVENRSGGAGSIGTSAVARAAPDGHTLLFGHVGMTMLPSLIANLSYDTQKDLIPVTQVTTSPLVMAVNAKLGVNSVAELVAYAKKNPGKLRWGLATLGASDHVAVSMFNRQAGIEALIVPFRSGGDAMVAAVGGTVDAVMLPASVVMPQTNAGALKALGVSIDREIPIAPGIAPIASAGYPGYEMSTWFGIWAPKNTPPDIIKKINDAVKTVLQDAEIQKRLLEQGALAIGSSSEDFSKRVDSDISRYGTVIKETGIKLD